MADSEIDAAIGRLSSPQPPPSAAQRIVDFVSKYWQFAGVLASIFVAGSAGFAYFATHAELVRVECQMSSNLLVVTLPNRVDQLQTKIQLANANLAKLAEGSPEAANEKSNIEDYKTEKTKANEQYDEALKKLQNHVCFNEPNAEKAPK